MTGSEPPIALIAADCAVRRRASTYPAAVVALVDAQLAGREKRPLGELFGLTRLGVNLTRLAPGAISALRHAHSRQDEFIYVLQGTPTLVTDAGDTPLAPGMCAGFAAGTGNAHRLINHSDADVVYLEIGDRTPDDQATYPDDDLAASLVDGQWRFTRKDGSDY
jgi:uncharacterized cupin superfamily protein